MPDIIDEIVKVARERDPEPELLMICYVDRVDDTPVGAWRMSLKLHGQDRLTLFAESLPALLAKLKGLEPDGK